MDNRWRLFTFMSILLLFIMTLGCGRDPTCPIPAALPEICPIPATLPEEREFSKYTSEERDYFKSYVEITKKTSASHTKLDASIEKLKANSRDPLALIIVSRELVNFGSYYDEEKRVSVPSGANPVHDSLTCALKEYNSALTVASTPSPDLPKLFDHLDGGKKLLCVSGDSYEQWKKGHK